MKPAARYSIGDVAELTGVATGTLRAWETRYALVTPTRTASAYRSYDDGDVEMFRRMRVLVDSGVPARRAARMAGDVGSVDGTSSADTEAAAGSLLGDHETLTRIAARFDPVALQRTLDEAFSLASVESVIDNWLMPSLTRLGEAWEIGQVDVAAEHFVTAAVMRRLAALFEATGSHGPRVLVGLPPKCRHELPLLAFAVCLRRAGVDVIYLGADMPLESWEAVVRASSPRAAVISAGHSRDVEAATATAETLRSHGVPVVYVGGHAAKDIPGGTPLPPRLSAAADVVSTALR
jgi:DNA-binding transcriptional MerR regulator/methylmalonyl-CoA mutase cobalamin-binding subunit